MDFWNKGCHYQYTPWQDGGKVYHDVYVTDESNDFSHTITMDWSPFSTPTEEEFQLWVKLGCPKRIGIAPLTHADLGKIAREQGL